MSLNQFTTQSAWKSITENVTFSFSWSSIGEWLFYTFNGYIEVSNSNFLLDNTKNPTPLIKGFYMCQLNFSTDGATNENIDLQLGYGKNEVLGSEMLFCGDFSCAEPRDEWTLGTGWTISGGSANCDGRQSSNSNLYQVVYVSGKTYKTIISVTSITGTLNVFTGSGAQTITITSSGEYEVVYTSTTTTMYLQATSSTVCSIDNISVKEVLVPDSIEWSDANLVFDSKGGNKWSTNLNALIHVKDVGETYGVELVDDGDFPLPNTAWLVVNSSTGVEENKAVITSSGSNAYIQQDISGTSGDIVKVTFNISDEVSSGLAYVRIDGTDIQQSGTWVSGTTTVYYTLVSSGVQTLQFMTYGADTLSFTLKDVSVKKVTPASTFQLRGKNTDGTTELNVNTLNANFIKIY